jgi:hypothetical protein
MTRVRKIFLPKEMTTKGSMSQPVRVTSSSSVSASYGQEGEKDTLFGNLGKSSAPSTSNMTIPMMSLPSAPNLYPLPDPRLAFIFADDRAGGVGGDTVKSTVAAPPPVVRVVTVSAVVFRVNPFRNLALTSAAVSLGGVADGASGAGLLLL